MKIITITDIHGEYNKLQQALEQAEAIGYDKLVFLGDYFDRAHGDVSSNTSTILWVLDHYRDKDKIFLLGNHDLWCKKFVNKNMHLSEQLCWIQANNGGDITFDSIEILSKKYPNIKSLMSEMYNSFLYYYMCGNWVFTHGGLDISKDFIEVTYMDVWGESFDKYILNNSNSNTRRFKVSKFFQNKNIVIGHNVVWQVDQTLVSKDAWLRVEEGSKAITKKDLDWNRIPLKLKLYNIYLTDVGVYCNDIPLITPVWDTEKK